MRLFADRFAVSEHDRGVDLASGRRVVIRVMSAGGASEQLAWGQRCDRFFQLRHRAFARLADYGRVGEAHRFEAWQCDGVWRGAATSAAEVVDRGRAFLRSSGLTDAGLDAGTVCTAGERPVLVPPDTAGLDAGVSDPPPAAAISVCGWAHGGSEQVLAIAEEFSRIESGPRAVSLWTDDELRLQAAAEELARAARLAGLVPVSIECAYAHQVEGISGRSLFLIAVDGPAQQERLLEWALRSPRGHVALFAGRADVRGMRGVCIPALSVEALARSVEPRWLSAHVQAAVVSAAQRSRGSLTRLSALLWGSARNRKEHDSMGVRVAETAAGYDVAVSGAAPDSPAPGRVWPAPGEIASLRRKLEAAVSLISSGRWAAGERTLRQTIGGLARRGEWERAAQGATALADALLRRGRAREALGLAQDGREYLSKAGDESAALHQIALITGRAWVDLARLDNAAAVLTTWLTPAAVSDLTCRGHVELARCFFWHGLYDQAGAAAQRADVEAASETTRIRAAAMLARAAVGRGDLPGAVSGASAAVARAATHPAGVVAEAARALAFAHLAVGDLDAVRADVAASLHAARAAHDPLGALKARLIEAEALRRRGTLGRGSAVVDRIKRIAPANLPPIVRLQAEWLGGLIKHPDGDGQRPAAGEAPLPALALFAPLPRRDERVPIAVADALDILRCVQNGADDLALLSDLCGSIKAKVGAAAVGFFACGAGAGTARAIAAEGRLDSEIARRVAGVADAVPPHAIGERVEGGVPVRYGGETIGAFVCRWTVAARLDAERAIAAMWVAAAAAAPAVAGALAGDRQGGGDDELVGTSGAMVDVRRAVDRAAQAPFSVVIEGESGSGKELVARALHRRGPRRARPFCTVNCAALPDDLVESELFGHARGAFTGAVGERTGVFEEAHSGTLFLDEVGELSPRAQAKVLRALQEGEVRRVGENLPRRIDVRIVSATNRDLKAEVAAGRFRLDLLYRLDVVHIAVPPLRDRRDDIPALVERYWRAASERVGGRAILSAATVAALARYDWPGNVRELQNVLAALAVRSPRRGLIQPDALPPAFGTSRPGRSWRLDQARRTFEEQFVRAALARTGGHRARAARELGLSRQGLTKLLGRLDITER